MTPFTRQTASRSGGPSEREIVPQAVPTVAADLCTEDVHVTEIVLTNNTNATRTVAIQDRQTTPAVLVSAYASMAAGQTSVLEFPGGALCIGGINWVASDTGVWARIKGWIG